MFSAAISGSYRATFEIRGKLGLEELLEFLQFKLLNCLQYRRKFRLFGGGSLDNIEGSEVRIEGSIFH